MGDNILRRGLKGIVEPGISKGIWRRYVGSAIEAHII